MPAHSATRPTSDRVREALFSGVISWARSGGDEALEGFSFLDLYAGSGAVALEAASRGAAPVRLVERDAGTARVAAANAASLGLAVELIRSSVALMLAGGTSGPFDIVFLDPPYSVAVAEVAADLAALAEYGWIGGDSLVVVERSSRTPDVEFRAPFLRVWRRRYGETTLHFAATQED